MFNLIVICKKKIVKKKCLFLTLSETSIKNIFTKLETDLEATSEINSRGNYSRMERVVGIDSGRTDHWGILLLGVAVVYIRYIIFQLERELGEDSVTKWVHHQGRNNETAPVEKFLLNCLLGIQIDGRSKVKHGETESFGSLVWLYYFVRTSCFRHISSI